jgi:hypothetical protein
MSVPQFPLARPWGRMKPLGSHTTTERTNRTQEQEFRMTVIKRTLKIKVIVYVSLKYRLTFNRLYGVISRKMELFITTAVRTSNPTHKLYYFS